MHPSDPTVANAPKTHNGALNLSAPCPHLLDGQICRIATTLADTGLPVFVQEQRCELCSSQDKPKGVNRITAALASRARRRRGLAPDPMLSQLLAQPAGGPGTELELIFNRFQWWLSWFGMGYLLDVDEESCGCGHVRDNMNFAGATICYQQRYGIRDRIIRNYLAAYPGRWFLKPLMKVVILSAILKAIKRHRRNVANEAPTCEDRTSVRNQLAVPSGPTEELSRAVQQEQAITRD